MKPLFLFMTFCLLTACTSPEKMAQIQFDEFRQATKIENPEPPVKLVEVIKPLPLPGQLKPLPASLKEKSPSQEGAVQKEKISSKDHKPSEAKVKDKPGAKQKTLKNGPQKADQISGPTQPPFGEIPEVEIPEKGKLFSDKANDKPDLSDPSSEKRFESGKNDQETIRQANAEAKRGPELNGYINAIQIYPFTQGVLYQLYAGVNKVTDITLQPGEQLVSVSAGDTVRWIIGDTRSGSGASTQAHILVKPVTKDLQTNLIITTDKRTYHLELHSTDETYMSSVSWTYPLDELIALKAENKAAKEIEDTVIERGLDPSHLNFRYVLQGTAPWKPVRVFDDGKKVYIQFPYSLTQGEAPPLFVLGSDGSPALVNYRMKGNTYIVDRLFAEAELRLGEKEQDHVRISRTDALRKNFSAKESNGSENN